MLLYVIWPSHTKNLSKREAFLLFEQYHFKDHSDTFQSLIIKNVFFLFSNFKQNIYCFSTKSFVLAFLTSEFSSYRWIYMSETERTSSVVVVVVIHPLKYVSNPDFRMLVKSFIDFEEHPISIIFVFFCHLLFLKR